MSQKTVHSCVRQENQCRIPLSFLGALVTSRIMNLFYISPFSELPLWLRHRDCHHAPTQRAGVCPRAAARIWQRLFPGAQPQRGARLSMGCGAGGAQTLPVSQFAATCCSFVHHHQDQAEVLLQEGMGSCCSRATHCCRTQSSLATGRRDEGRRLYQTPQSTYYRENLFSNTFPELLCIHSHPGQDTLSPHIPQTGLWAAISDTPRAL